MTNQAAAIASAETTLVALGFTFFPGVASPHGMFRRADGVAVYWHDNGEEDGWMILAGAEGYWLGRDEVPADLRPLADTLAALPLYQTTWRASFGPMHDTTPDEAAAAELRARLVGYGYRLATSFGRVHHYTR